MGIISLKKHIFICGGSNDDLGSLDSVEKYSIETDSWSSLCPMNFKRNQPKIVALGKYLYVLGDMTSKGDAEKVKYPMYNIFLI